jgi:decaprenylphospho-beta-D-ribofuranose 2-oxidase
MIEQHIAREFAPLPVERLQRLEGWAMVRRSDGYVWQPQSIDEIHAVLALARQTGHTIVSRGAGFSYNDAALNGENIVLECTRMNHIQAWDPATGIITVEAGVTIGDLWHTTLPDGWWPPVVPGTMSPTMGGCLAMNVHGKNAWNVGSFGEHVLAFDLLTTAGDLVHVTPEDQPDLFHAVIGGLGMLGIVTSVTLQMRRVANGRLRARQSAAPDLAGMFALFAANVSDADYLVGWIDGFASGAQLGRGLVDRGDFLAESDPSSLQRTAQDLPPRIAGIMPRDQMWRAMRAAFNAPMMRLGNTMQYTKSARSGGHERLVPHAQFHFLHDYLPHWKRAFLPGGERQFQVFVPTEAAPAVFGELLRCAQRAGLPPYLCVFKQHRSDPFLLPYQLNGFSLSLDFPHTASNAARLDQLLHEMRALVVEAGGRFYLAKDDSIDAATYARTVGADRIASFQAIKRQMDPDGLLRSQLYGRVMG